MSDYQACAARADALAKQPSLRRMFDMYMDACKKATHARNDETKAEARESRELHYSKVICDVLNAANMPEALGDVLDEQAEVRAAFDATHKLASHFTNWSKKQPAKLEIEKNKAYGVAIAGILFQAELIVQPRAEGGILKIPGRDPVYHSPPNDGLRTSRLVFSRAGDSVREIPSKRDSRHENRNDRQAEEAGQDAGEGGRPARKRRGPPPAAPPDAQEAANVWSSVEGQQAVGGASPAPISQDQVDTESEDEQEAENNVAPVFPVQVGENNNGIIAPVDPAPENNNGIIAPVDPAAENNGMGENPLDKATQTDFTGLQQEVQTDTAFGPVCTVQYIVTLPGPVPVPQAGPAPAPAPENNPAPAPADPAPAPALSAADPAPAPAPAPAEPAPAPAPPAEANDAMVDLTGDSDD